MAKVVSSANGSSLDPFAFITDIDKQLGTSGNPTLDLGLENTQQGTKFYSGVDLKGSTNTSLLGNDILGEQVMNETSAENQGGLELAGKMLYNIGATGLFEAGKTLGYAGGGIEAIGNELFGNGKNSMEMMVDNGFVNALDKMEQSVKDYFPVQIQKDVQDGSMMRKLGSGEWWASTGADGIGFLLSMYAPGQALKAFGIGEKLGSLAEGIANLGKVAEVGETGALLEGKSGLIGKMLGLTSTEGGSQIASNAWKSGVEGTAALSANTVLEAAAEASNTFDNTVNNMKEQHPDWSDDQIKQKAGENASAVFKGNIPILLVSNLIDEAYFFKTFGGLQKSAEKGLIGKLLETGKLDEAMIAKIRNQGFMKTFGEYSKEFGMEAIKGVGKEGVLEEGSQTLLQQQIEGNGTDHSFMALGDIMSSYKDYLHKVTTNNELIESITLGGILGGVMGGFHGVKSKIAEKNAWLGQKEFNPNMVQRFIGMQQTKATKGIANVINDNFIAQYKTLNDVLVRDANGKIQTDENNNPILDPNKLAALTEDKQNQLEASLQYNLALQNGDKSDADRLLNQITYNYIQPFLDIADGKKLLDGHVRNQVVEQWANQYRESTGREATDEMKKEYVEKFKQKSDMIFDIHKEVTDTHAPQTKFAVDDPLYKEWTNNLFIDKISTLLNYHSLEQTQKELKKEEIETMANAVLSDTQKAHPIFKDGVNFKSLAQYIKETKDNNITGVTPQLIGSLGKNRILRMTVDNTRKKLLEHYQTLFDKEGLKNHFEDYKKGQEKLNKQQEQIVEETKKTQEEIATKSSEFYDTPEMKSNKPEVVVEDKDGNRFVVHNIVNSDGTITREISEDQGGVRGRLTDEQITRLDLKPVSEETLKQEQLDYEFEQRKIEVQNVLAKKEKEYKDRLDKIENDLKEIENQLEEHQFEIDALTEEDKYLRKVKNLKSLLSKHEKQIKSLSKQKELLTKEKERLQKALTNVETALSIEDRIDKTTDELKKEYDELFKDLPQDLKNKTVSELLQFKQEIQNKIEDVNKLVQRTEKLAKKILSDYHNLLRKLDVPHERLERLNNKLRNNLDEIQKLDEQLETLYNREEEEINKGNKHVNSFGTKQIPEIQDRIKELEEDNKDILRHLFKISSDLQEKVDKKKDELKHMTQEKIRKLIDVKEGLDDKIEQLEKEKELLNDILYYRKKQYQEALVKEDEKLRQKKEDIKRKAQEAKDKKENKGKKEEVVKPTTPIVNSESIPFPTEEKGKPKPQKEQSDFSQNKVSHTDKHTGGNQIQYETNEKGKTVDKLDADGNIIFTDSKEQNTWFDTLDDIANNEDVTQFKLKVYHFDYDKTGKTNAENQIANSLPDTAKLNDDIWVVMTDETGKELYRDKDGKLNTKGDGILVFTSLYKTETAYPDGKVPRIQIPFIINPFLLKNGISTVLTKEDIFSKSDEKISKHFSKEEVEKLEKLLGKKDLLIKDVYAEAVKQSKEDYNKFRENLKEGIKKGNTILLKNKQISMGIAIQQRDRTDGNKVMFDKPIISNDGNKNGLNGITLTHNTGKDALQGAKLEVSINGTVTAGENVVSVPQGDVVVIHGKEQIISPTKARNINRDEAELILHLITLALNFKSEKDAIIKLPKGKSVTINGKVLTNIPLFFSEDEALKNFSLLQSFINYGDKNLTEEQRKITPHVKGDIKVYVNKKGSDVVFTDWEGITHRVTLSDIKQSLEDGTFVDTPIYKFLLESKHNVSQTLVENNDLGQFKLLDKRNTKGEKTIVYDDSKTYYERLLIGEDRILSTSHIHLDNATRVQRYLVFEDKIDDFGAKQKAEPIKTKPQSDDGMTPQERHAYNMQMGIKPTSTKTKTSKSTESKKEEVKPTVKEESKLSPQEEFYMKMQGVNNETKVGNIIKEIEDITEQRKRDLDKAIEEWNIENNKTNPNEVVFAMNNGGDLLQQLHTEKKVEETKPIETKVDDINKRIDDIYKNAPKEAKEKNGNQPDESDERNDKALIKILLTKGDIDVTIYKGSFAYYLKDNKDKILEVINKVEEKQKIEPVKQKVELTEYQRKAINLFRSLNIVRNSTKISEKDFMILCGFLDNVDGKPYDVNDFDNGIKRTNNMYGGSIRLLGPTEGVQFTSINGDADFLNAVENKITFVNRTTTPINESFEAKLKESNNTETKPLSAAERLLGNNTNKSSFKGITRDKVSKINPEQLLQQKIQNNEIKQNCK